MRLESKIYAGGVVLLGLGHETLRSATGGTWLAIPVAIVYLLIVRVIGRWAIRRWPDASE